MANSLLVVNADGPETRVALVEGGLLAELYIERKRERGIAGNIYKGRVERVLPGMQAAFLNIGLEKSAYIHVSDVRGTPDDLKRLMAAGDSRGDNDDDEEPSAANGARIEDLLKEGQEIVVQVTKEPISTKGARTTRYISLPGRHLVFMPTVDHIGISRRISSDKERRRLREIVEQMRPPGSGFIVRTVAEGVPEKDLRADMAFLIKMWNEVVAKIETARCPSLIYNDLDLLLRTVRDLFTAEVEKLIIDSRNEYDRIKKFIVDLHARLQRADRAVRRHRADLRRVRHRDRDRPRPRAQGLAEVGRLSDRRRDGGADRGGREHRALRRQEEPRRHHHPDQPGGRPGGGRAAAHPLHRRDDRGRLHRHGPRLATATR